MSEIKPERGWAIAYNGGDGWELSVQFFCTRRQAILWWSDGNDMSYWHSHRRRGIVRAVRVEIRVLEGRDDE